jgi:hypothetical protein
VDGFDCFWISTHQSLALVEEVISSLDQIIEEYNTKVRECMRFNGKAKAKETLVLRIRFDELWKKIS